MAGSPPKPPPPTFAAGSSSPKPPPPTFTFHPHDEALIDSYLRHRVVSGTKVDFIHEADLYSADPDQLTSKYAAATASNGERAWRAWYFFTPLRFQGSSKKRVKRNVNMGTGREGSWVDSGGAVNVYNGQRQIGRRRRFHFEEKVGRKTVKSAWRMMEFRLDANEGGQEAGSSDLFVLSKVYRRWDAKADDENSTAVAKADGETSAASASASAVVTPGHKGADEEIGAETAAGPGRKRKAGDKDPGAETVASSPGRQKKADGESAGAATTGEMFADSKDPVDAAEKAEQEEPGVPRDGRSYDFFGDSSAPVDAPEEAEQEEPRDPTEPPFFYDFFGDSSAPPS